MYTVHQAKTNLSRLLKEAEAGKDVLIARGKTPVARLVPLRPTRKKRVPGRFKGLMWASEDAFAPMTPEELADWGIE